MSRRITNVMINEVHATLMIAQTFHCNTIILLLHNFNSHKLALDD